MAQDIREMFRKQELKNTQKLRKGHQSRFAARLENSELKPKATPKSNNLYLKIAAVLIVALGVGFYFLLPGNQQFNENPVVETPVQENKDASSRTEYHLSDKSPEFKKVEDYYLASLNIQLAKLEINDKNKELIDAFMAKLAELDNEYKALNNEIQEAGVNEETVEAMVGNLQLRLNLLSKLKNKLKEIEQSKNESYENYQA